MQFEWDQQKNEANIQKHGLSFADAHQVFEHPMLANVDDRQEYGEDRWIGIGLMNMRVVVVVFAEPDENTIRIISFRKAKIDERKRYERAYRDEFGAS
jgi:uncharacterized protein